eukprot:12755355-Ditylum_brightwellii.AAC.1
MVWGSELAFRMTCRSHSTNILGLCYTPMLRSEKILGGDVHELHLLDETCTFDAPTRVVQLCGANPTVLADAARLVVQRTSGQIFGIDLNLGCPKDCAKKGGYGAFLVDRDVDLASKCVAAMCEAVHPIPVSCKIRIAEDDENDATSSCDATINVALRMQKAGARWITLHCRKRNDETRSTLPNYALGANVVKALSIPVVLNGGIDSVQKARMVLKQTGCFAVMAATSFLADPFFLTNPPAGMKRCP